MIMKEEITQRENLINLNPNAMKRCTVTKGTDHSAQDIILGHTT